MKEKFGLLSLDKMTIVELSDEQLGSMKGGQAVALDDEGATCRDGGITCVNASSSCRENVS